MPGHHNVIFGSGGAALAQIHLSPTVIFSRLVQWLGYLGLQMRSSVVEHSAAVRMVPGSNPGVPSVYALLLRPLAHLAQR